MLVHKKIVELNIFMEMSQLYYFNKVHGLISNENKQKLFLTSQKKKKKSEQNRFIWHKNCSSDDTAGSENKNIYETWYWWKNKRNDNEQLYSCCDVWLKH